MIIILQRKKTGFDKTSILILDDFQENLIFTWKYSQKVKMKKNILLIYVFSLINVYSCGECYCWFSLFCTATVLLWLVFFFFSYKRNSRNCNFILLYIVHIYGIYTFRKTFFLFAALNYLLRAQKCNQCVKLDNLKSNKVFNLHVDSLRSRSVEKGVCTLKTKSWMKDMPGSLSSVDQLLT